MASMADKHLQEATKEIKQDTLDSLGRTRAALEDSLNVADATSERLVEQREQIHKIQDDVDQVKDASAKSHKLLDKLSWWAWTRPSKTYKGGGKEPAASKKRAEEEPEPASLSKAAAERQSIEERLAKSTEQQQQQQQATPKLVPITLTAEPQLIGPISGAAAEVERTASDEAIDSAVGDIDKMLGQLQGTATDFSRELKEQKKEIEKLEPGVQAANESVQSASKRTGWFIKKL
eukprot:CAMPEP_0118970268 /NCGR_PEP_ID=MMETSP1173-20130426/7206_1 /TAXON_ID=1034831 /ORGANISM="Rhizochromulina marina cf, Strain CCMP1243" /LENGTH=233 /DNA_ID=CAMNT_0006919609 /DNA_START=41 /DNA_END=742 /DNA_ORIENTATION=-